MFKTGIPDQKARDTINQFLNSYKEHETLKNTQQGTLQQAKERLKKAAASISSGDVPDDQPANLGTLTYNGALDFFFTVLERHDLKFILQEAFDGLIGAMKGLEHRKITKAADGSESERDDKTADEGEDEAPPKRSRSPNLPSNNRKKQKLFHPAPPEDDDTPMF